MRIKEEVHADLARLRAQLLRKAKRGWITADDAMELYASALAQVVRNPACHMVDDRQQTPVKCRRCGRESSVIKGADHWNCRCTPSVKRYLATDMIDATGAYAVDPNALPVGA
jgi:hypothetical protein